jgi:5-methylcytosine-specific restriction endonuclease McrA
LRSKEPEYTAAYWRRWAAANRPRVTRECACGTAFSPRGPQKRCEACLVQTCITCGKQWRETSGRARKACSRRCAALQPHVVERINRHRGVKPRTYAKTRGKHGSAEDREWRELVFRRDDYTCQMCGVKGGRLQADHIKPYADHPELRHELSNGRTLCVPCHRSTPTYGWGAYWQRKRATRSLLNDSAKKSSHSQTSAQPNQEKR